MKAFPSGHAPMLSFYLPFGLFGLSPISPSYRFNTIPTTNSGADRVQNISNEFWEGNRQGPALFGTVGQGCLEFRMNMVWLYREISFGPLWRNRMKLPVAFLKRKSNSYNF